MTRRTKQYIDYIQSEAWRLKKAQIIFVRGRQCERCKKGDYLQLHHLNYDRLGHELDSDLQLLCVKCHKKADQHREARTRYRQCSRYLHPKKVRRSSTTQCESGIRQVVSTETRGARLMTDIVERLRDPGVFVDREEVASEIERLRVEIKRWQTIASQGVAIERDLRTEIAQERKI